MAARLQKGNVFGASTDGVSAAVYRTTPAPGGSTTSLPSDGSTVGSEVWAEVYGPGASTPSYLLVTPKTRVVSSGERRTVDA